MVSVPVETEDIYFTVTIREMVFKFGEVDEVIEVIMIREGIIKMEVNRTLC